MFRFKFMSHVAEASCSQPDANRLVYVANRMLKLNTQPSVAMAGVDMRLEAGAIRSVRLAEIDNA